MANKEQLSALMDGESIDLEVINELENDAELSEAWQRYHSIGDALRGEEIANPAWDITASVAAALEQEPAHTQLPQTAKVIPLLEDQPTPKAASLAWPSWLSQLGQVAIAASVSLAVIVGVQQYSGQQGVNAPSQSPVLQTIPFAGSVEPVSLTRDSLTNSSETALTEEEILEQRQKINSMMQDYELQLRFQLGELESGELSAP